MLTINFHQLLCSELTTHVVMLVHQAIKATSISNCVSLIIYLETACYYCLLLLHVHSIFFVVLPV